MQGVELIASQIAGRLPFIVGVTASNKFEAAEYAYHARTVGASGILTMPQTDNQPVDTDMFREYLIAVNGGGSGLPICIQTSYPGHQSHVSPDLVLRLSSEIPAIRYVKEEQIGFGTLPSRITYYIKNGRDQLGLFGGAGARSLLNELARGSSGTMPGAGFADVQTQIYESFASGHQSAARQLFSKMLMMAVLEQNVGYALQKEILRRRGVFENSMMRHTRRQPMDDGDMAELDDIFEVLRPHLML